MADAGSKRCPICGASFERRDGELLSHFTKRQTCGLMECYRQLQSVSGSKSHPAATNDGIAWPERTGEVEAEFWRHNIDPGDVRGSIPLRPATHVATEANT
jgi:hypothetical protein